MAASDVSEGENFEDLSEISSAESFDYFENLKRLTSRKLELELENTIVFEQIAGCGKENHHSNRRPSKRKRLKSSNRHETATRNLPRSRSYRSSSILSNYSIKKRKKSWSAFRKPSKAKRPKRRKELSDEEKVDDLDESNDEELLELRLNALKSKQEVKELINEEEEAKSLLAKPSEEEDLRIIALRSALLKKKDFYKERKKKKMMESERPYSPSDDLPPIALDDDEDVMVLSPLGSPFKEVEAQQEEIDMDISNSPANEERELSDMDTAPSPGGVVEEIQTVVEDNDDEVALRSLLLTSINSRKKEKSPSPTNDQNTEDFSEDNSETKKIAQNLLLAVQRLKQKKQVIQVPTKKSGSKTIAMVLEESKNKKKKKLEEDQLLVQPEREVKEVKEVHPEREVKEVHSVPDVEEFVEAKSSREDSPVDSSRNESFLIRTITNDFMIPEQSKAVEAGFVQLDRDTSFSTITDTKNIPILPAKAKQSRLITSLDSVKKPVSRLVITIGANSDTEDEREASSDLRKTSRNIFQSPAAKTAVQPGFEKNLDSFLKKIRLQQEVKGSEKKPSSEPSTVSPPPKLTKVSSSVKHLPLSSQVEYEQLLQKMKVLEEAKLKRAKARHSKRLKSCSLSVDKPAATLKSSPTKKEPIKAPTVAPADTSKATSLDKISDSLKKIPQLDESAQQRLIEKTEISFKNHSINLFASTEENIKLLEENEADMKKQGRLQAHIADLELLLKKYKSNLVAVDQRIKVNVHKIVQSQRSMITLRTRQRNFGKICQQAGTMIRGKDYSLPEHKSVEVEENLSKIAEKTDDILKATTDQKVKDYIKLIADRVKSLSAVKTNTCQLQSKTSAEPSVVNEEPSAKEIEQTVTEVSQSSIPAVDNPGGQAEDNPGGQAEDNPGGQAEDNPGDPAEDNEEESEVSRMLRENSENSSMPEEANEEVEFPEIQKPANKRRLLEEGVSGSGSVVEKKLKYESPLEFMRLPESNKKPSVNKILCPYHLEGTCSDERCKMMHI